MRISNETAAQMEAVLAKHLATDPGLGPILAKLDPADAAAIIDALDTVRAAG